jgi:glycosyltransferase involved in cell wall biosynthesis
MPTDSGQLKVAVIHDWLTGMRGGENVLEAILELFPESEIFTLFYIPGKLSPRIENHPIHTSFLNKIPYAHKFYKLLLPLFPLAIEHFDLSSFGLVISSSHCVAKGVIPSPDALHICYCHTPMRYAWDKRKDYFGSPWKSFLTSGFLHRLRIWDTVSSSRTDYFIANSNWVRARINKYYRRQSHVIHPFVDASFLKANPAVTRDYYLVVSALVPYKKVELAIQACEKMKRKLLIVGSGDEELRLRNLATSTTEFLGRVSGEKLKELYSGARALLFPGEEDFGITPLEAMGTGTPVIAFERGGVLETVVPNQTGLFFKDQTVDSLLSAIQDFESRTINWENQCIERARQFSKEHFMNSFRAFVENALKQSI